MRISKETAKQEIAKLVAKLAELSPAERDAYKKKEENTKKDLILPLFRALGWDVEDAREVFAEYDASKGAVDYAFKIGGVSRFFVEAKPLEANLTDARPIRQAIGYALHRGVPWAVLTSFDNLHIFYALGEATKPDMLRWKTLHYTDYIPHFDDLWLLSRESMESGATDEAAQRDGRLPPRLTIEQRLFRQFREWREKLTNDLLRYHQGKLTDAQVDEVVQRLFNRLIFIRNCEDRQIEDRLLWQAWQEWIGKKRNGSLVSSVRNIFSQFRVWYDSDLFPDKPHLLDRPDLVHLDNNPLEEVVHGLYTLPGGYADYDFKLIDADVLGAVYEQYLGHVAQVARERAGQKERAQQLGFTEMATPRVEFVEKRAKRKQQGIYYTPKWVVDYIVRETVGRALDEGSRAKGAAEDRLFSIRILDPACGSGSFLIRAYDELLHRAAALSDRPKEHIFADERGAILKSSIYGVDLDPQAVDIARLNLMLRGLARRERLPELKENVQTGNSLIFGVENELRPYFGDAWESKHPFNWAERFPQVMREGGFDVVIGNPPYVRIQNLPRQEADYYRKHYDSAQGSFDLYVTFIERSIRLLKTGGRLGFITSGKFLKAAYGRKLQSLLRRDATVETIIDLSSHQVFGEATTYPLILILKKGASPGELTYFELPSKARLPEANERLDDAVLPRVRVPQDAITSGIWPPLRGRTSKLIDRLGKSSDSLQKVAQQISQGLKTGADKVFVVSLVSIRNERAEVFSQSLNRTVTIDAALLRPIVKIEHMRRYSLQPTSLRVIFPYEGRKVIDEATMKSKWGRTYNYLLANERQLRQRDHGVIDSPVWYGFSRNQALDIVNRPKLLTPDASPSASFCYDTTGEYSFSGGFAGGYAVTLEDAREYPYVLAILNSRLSDFLLRGRSTRFRGGYLSYESRFIKYIPIHRVAPTIKAHAQLHDRIVQLVERMLELKRCLAAKGDARDSEREDLERETERIDREIDRAVYDLYGLTEAQRYLVEEEMKG